jgi:SpoVK/Ycf46/Vps4 family AAA+-type ATPase
MDLDFPVHTTGRAAAPPPVEVIGEVEQADLELLKIEGRPSGQTPHLQRLSDRHHSVARLLALGHAPWEVSAITGYDPSRIAILQSDPTFKHLLACYREAEGQGVADLAARVRDAAATAVTKVLERLEEDPTIEFSDLSRATRDLLDRAGYGAKSTKEVNINVGLAERVELARQRAIRARGEAPPMTAPPMLELEADG